MNFLIKILISYWIGYFLVYMLCGIVCVLQNISDILYTDNFSVGTFYKSCTDYETHIFFFCFYGLHATGSGGRCNWCFKGSTWATLRFTTQWRRESFPSYLLMRPLKYNECNDNNKSMEKSHYNPTPLEPNFLRQK